jgi:beta-fructofuranosidase
MIIRLFFILAGLIAGHFGPRAAELIPHDQAAIDRAMESDEKAALKAEKDPDRPAFHFLPRANWMNDPNGPIYYKGYYHMFYQHNPYGDSWGHMHWGHARSRDLVHWEHLPVALWPSTEAGEDHVFSGCATIRADGVPFILYTSIGRGKSATDYAEQWAALGDDQLLEWKKAPGNPALSPSIHGGVKVWDWRDPFLFKYNGGDYLVLGGNLNHGKGGEGVVNLYKAKDSSLMHWEYLGVLFTHPDPKVGNIECPNFFELDGKWVLIVSPHRRVDYFVGQFDGQKFTPEKKGVLDQSPDFYAPNSMTDDKGRRLLWGWLHGFKGDRGWNGCLSLPRELKIGPDDQLWQRPAVEMLSLRGKTLLKSEQKPLNKSMVIESGSRQLEILATIFSGEECGLRLTGGASDAGIVISHAKNTLKIGSNSSPLELHDGEPLNLHVFLDHSVMEVYANDHFASARVVQSALPPQGRTRIELYSLVANTRASMQVYELKIP